MFPTDAVLAATAHRPWPMPDEPWLMTQSWHDLLFAHWRVEASALRSLVPAVLPLDLFDGSAWLGIVPFHMSNVSPRGVPPLPFVSAFPELNVRTYVTLGGKPGVFFFSLDASNAVAVTTARTVLGLPYFQADMTVTAADWVTYRSRRLQPNAPSAEFEARYRPSGPTFQAQPGTLEYFLTERYCLYTTDSAGTPKRLEIHHPAWSLRPAEAIITTNTMASAQGISLPDTAPLLHFAKRQDMIAFGMHAV